MGRFPKCWDRSIQMNWFKDNLTFVLISLLWFMAYDRLHYLTGGHINIHMYTLYTIHYTRTCTCVYCSLHKSLSTCSITSQLFGLKNNTCLHGLSPKFQYIYASKQELLNLHTLKIYIESAIIWKLSI